MQNCPIQRIALVLLMLVGMASVVAVAVAAWGLDFTGWIALAALGLSAVLVAAGRRLHEAWQEARWDAGQRLR
jgi:hypothetical protein